MIATRTKLTTGFVALRHGCEVHVLRFDTAHPLAAYAVLERWLRDGVLCQWEFGYLIGVIAQEATEASK